MLLFLN